MASLWSKPIQEAPEALNSEKDVADVADTGLADVGLPSPSPQPLTSVPMGRPMLQRDQPQPPPPHQPPPPPSPQQSSGNPQDSLSLMQLKRIVNEFPRTDPTLYAFEYTDTALFGEEIDEWFSYNDSEFKRLYHARDVFQRRWQNFSGGRSWFAGSEKHKEFVAKEIAGLAATDLRRRCKSLQSVLHIILGVWDETAGISDPEIESDINTRKKSKATSNQIRTMKEGILMVADAGGVKLLFENFQNCFTTLWDEEARNGSISEEDLLVLSEELDNVTTAMYLIIEGARNDQSSLRTVKEKILELNPSIINYLMSITARLRWDEGNDPPQVRIFLLFWKSLLLIFGSTTDVVEVKQAIKENTDPTGPSGKLITASPLDYHIFRQEITSKYPAYVPPQPLIPLEPDNNSILPPLPNRTGKRNGESGIIPTPIGLNTSGASILHQPVHIATPAPSPPPSPPVGGKAGKKQNYQTNQNFPFLYPPLDSTSNSAGGKGAAGLQEHLVGRRWEGSDIPASIIEAGDLFAKSMRMTRAMRQLWNERERFLRFDRGWEDRDEDDDVEELDLETILAKKLTMEATKPSAPEVDYGPEPENVDLRIKQKLDLIEEFYGDSLPHLQSLVIVLLKAVLTNVTSLLTQPMNGQQGGTGPGYRPEGNIRPGAAQGQNRQQNPAEMPLPAPVDIADISVEELEAIRSREITAKAVSGILLSLLKWFKVSHILKFEYLTQLLLDSNYLPLILKLFAHQEIERVVESKADREHLSFFSFCNSNSVNAATVPDDESDDDAAPPPIKLNREFGSQDQLPALAFQEGQIAGRRENTEVDEMGYPVNDLPAEPITEFSWRNFYSTINFLRIMQKICKNKAHRNLLLVQYKSSNILKKSLKIPQPELRLYTLKLFKNQVPYCGRKWRQGNMRVITAVYLHCRPELRDDWLAGSDVDAEVEEALPLEQALRSLTHWHNVKRYPKQMGANVQLLEEEHDFFIRELERMEYVEESVGGESVADSAWDGGAPNW